MLTAVFAVVIFRAAFKTLVILTPLLGVTWLLGFISIHNNSLVFQYLFAVVNSLQVTVKQFCKLCTKSKTRAGAGNGSAWGRGEYNEEAPLQDGNSWPFMIYILLKRYLPLDIVKNVKVKEK